MRRIAAAVGVAAGFVLLSPVVASAAEAPTGNPTSMKVEVDDADNVTIEGTCVNSAVQAEAGYRVPGGHRPILHGDLIMQGKTGSVTYKHVPPGKYEAYIYCYEGGPGDHRGPVRTFTVGKSAQSAQPAKPTQTAPQVGVKPQGAPQTGGGPADDESTATPLLVGGAIALVGATGAGALVLRRRAARR